MPRVAGQSTDAAGLQTVPRVAGQSTDAAGLQTVPRVAGQSTDAAGLQTVPPVAGQSTDAAGLQTVPRVARSGDRPHQEGVARSGDRPHQEGSGHSALRTPHSALPGRVLAIAHRVDALVGYIGVGRAPVGARDPLGLGGMAAELVAILLESPAISLGTLIGQAYALYEQGPGWRSLDVTRAAFLDFLRTRLEAVLVARGIRPDTTDAVLDAGFDDVPAALARARVLEAVRDTPEGTAFLEAAARVAALLRFAGRSEMFPSPGEVRMDLLEEDAELALYGAYLEVRPQVLQAAIAGNYAAVLRLLGELPQHLSEFLDSVLVMSDDEALRDNRLRLLAEVQSLFLEVADPARLAVDVE